MLGEWVKLNDWQQLPDVPGIYAIRHCESQKTYVGQSKNVRQRVASHRRAVSWHYFGRALRRHGLGAFDVCLLAVGAPEDLGRLEQEAIERLGTLAPAGYNLAAGGLGPIGVTWSYERRQAQSLARTGFQHRPDSIEKMREAAHKNNGFKGKKHTAEAKVRIGAATVRIHTGLKRSVETCQRISEAKKGKPGWTPNAAQREAASAARKGRPVPHLVRPGELNGMYGKPGPLKGKRGGEHPTARTVGIWVPGSMTPITVHSVTEAAAWAGTSVKHMCDLCAGKHRPRSGTMYAYL